MKSEIETMKGNILKCPQCGTEYLHQIETNIYERNEDAEALESTHVCVHGKYVLIDKNMSGNPSSRRHGLSILFNCENCDCKRILNIYQHKGETFIEWNM